MGLADRLPSRKAAAFCLLVTACSVAVAMGQPAEAVVDPAAQTAAAPRPPSVRATKLFSEPEGDVLPASDIIARNKPINGEIATMAVAGGELLLCK